MYPPLYIRCCIHELYSITFKYIPTISNDILFYQIQIRLRQCLYSIILEHRPDYRKQSRKLFSIQSDHSVYPEHQIRMCYVEEMKWGDLTITGLQISLATVFIEDHHYDQLVMLTDEHQWKSTMMDSLHGFFTSIP